MNKEKRPMNPISKRVFAQRARWERERVAQPRMPTGDRNVSRRTQLQRARRERARRKMHEQEDETSHAQKIVGMETVHEGSDDHDDSQSETMAKAKGKDKPAASTVPAEAEEVPAEVEATVDDVTAESSLCDPVKMEKETTIDAGFDKAEGSNKPEEAEKLQDAEMETEVKEDEAVEAAVTTNTPGGEELEEGEKTEKPKSDENVKKTLSKKAKRRLKRKEAADAGATTSNSADKPETSSPEKKGLKKADGMGLIFMCNSETKKDCFRLKVLGLPENKKDLVAKVYKGMRLFLYNIDDKMLYGIFKASSPGGYNIEPKAFKSGFPSQVRFTVLEDCNPLPIEKFRAAIKANFFGKSKFNAQLSREQVKDLCKLFKSETKTPKQKRVGGGPSKAPNSTGRDWSRRPPPRDVQRSAPYYPRGLSYPREPYAPHLAQRAPLPPPMPLPPYAYERPVDDYYYRREPEPVEYRDPYIMYREPAAYSEPIYPSSRLSYAPPPPYRY